VIVDRRVGRDDDGIASNHWAARRHDARGPAGLDLRYVSTMMQPHIVPGCSKRDAAQVGQDVEFSLVGKAQRTAGVERLERHAIDQLCARDAGPAHGVQLLDQQLLIALRLKQISVHALEVAVNLLRRHDALDLVDGGGVALGSKARTIPAMQALDRDIAVVERAAQMRGGAASLAAGDRSIIQHHDLAAGTGHAIGNGQASDARADNADVGAQIARQRATSRDARDAHPQRAGHPIVGCELILSIAVRHGGDPEVEVRPSEKTCQPPSALRLAGLSTSWQSANGMNSGSELSAALRPCLAGRLPGGAFPTSCFAPGLGFDLPARLVALVAIAGFDFGFGMLSPVGGQRSADVVGFNEGRAAFVTTHIPFVGSRVDQFSFPRHVVNYMREQRIWGSRLSRPSQSGHLFDLLGQASVAFLHHFACLLRHSWAGISRLVHLKQMVT